MPLGEPVEVEQHLLAGQRGLVGGAVLVGLRGSPVGRVGDGDPAAGAVLAALEGAAVVPVAAAACRDRQVGLEGPGLDLLEDRLPQVREVGRDRLRVVVLRLEQREHRRVVLVAQPLVLVDAGAAVVGGGDRPAVRDRRGEQGLRHAANLGRAPQSPAPPGGGRHRPTVAR